MFKGAPRTTSGLVQTPELNKNVLYLYHTHISVDRLIQDFLLLWCANNVFEPQTTTEVERREESTPRWKRNELNDYERVAASCSSLGAAAVDGHQALALLHLRAQEQRDLCHLCPGRCGCWRRSIQRWHGLYLEELQPRQTVRPD
jgi:hypothetical protein